MRDVFCYCAWAFQHASRTDSCIPVVRRNKLIETELYILSDGQTQGPAVLHEIKFMYHHIILVQRVQYRHNHGIPFNQFKR